MLTTNTISIHEKLSDSLANIPQKAYEIYGTEGIRKHGLDRYGGSFNCRKKRGSLSAWSTHAWWEILEQEGWVSLGRTEDQDWMYVQAAKR